MGNKITRKVLVAQDFTITDPIIFEKELNSLGGHYSVIFYEELRNYIGDTISKRTSWYSKPSLTEKFKNNFSHICIYSFIKNIIKGTIVNAGLSKLSGIFSVKNDAAFLSGYKKGVLSVTDTIKESIRKSYEVNGKAYNETCAIMDKNRNIVNQMDTSIFAQNMGFLSLGFVSAFMYEVFNIDETFFENTQKMRKCLELLDEKIKKLKIFSL